MKENKRFGKGQKIMNRKLAKKEAELRKKFTNHATKNNKSKQVFFTFRKTRIQIQFRPEQEEPMSQEHQPNPKGGFIKHSFIAVKVFTKLADGSKHFKGWFQNLPFSREARKTNSMLGRWGRWTGVKPVVQKFEAMVKKGNLEPNK